MAITVKNCLEQFVIDLLPQVLSSYPDACKCDQCKSDIVAWSLNHLKPHYVGTAMGDTYMRLSIYDSKNMAKIIQTIAEGVEIISAHPHHMREQDRLKK